MLFLTEVINKEVAHKKPKQLFQIKPINTVKSDPAAGVGPQVEMTQFKKEMEHTGQKYKVRLLWKPLPTSSK